MKYKVYYDLVSGEEISIKNCSGCLKFESCDLVGKTQENHTFPKDCPLRDKNVPCKCPNCGETRYYLDDKILSGLYYYRIECARCKLSSPFFAGYDETVDCWDKMALNWGRKIEIEGE